jgi:hypothetical protein
VRAIFIRRYEAGNLRWKWSDVIKSELEKPRVDNGDYNPSSGTSKVSISTRIFKFMLKLFIYQQVIN